MKHDSVHISVFQLVVFLVSDIWSTSIGKALGSIASSFLGAGFQVAAILLLSQLIQNDAKLIVPGFVLGMEVPETLVGEISLFPSSAVIVILLFLASLLIYLASVLTLRLAVQFEKEGTYKAIKAVSTFQNATSVGISKSKFREYSKVCTSYPRIVGRVLRAGLMLPHFALQAAAMFVLLIVNNANLTLIVFAFLFLSFGIQVLINRKGSVLSKEFEENTVKAQKVKKRILGSYMEGGDLLYSDLQESLESEEITKGIDSYYKRLVVLDEAFLVGGLTVGIVVLVLISSIAFFGSADGNIDWAKYFTYIILTVFFLRSAQSAAQLITFNSRFAHQIKVYYSLVKHEKVDEGD